MIISMCEKVKQRGGQDQIWKDLIAITNRQLCPGFDQLAENGWQNAYLRQIEKIASLGPAGLILREKDLEKDDYKKVAIRVQEICHRYQVPFFVHSHVGLAREIGCKNIHLSIPGLRNFICQTRSADDFSCISVSCHSLEDVEEAVTAGAGQIVLGTIFETQCKPGLTGRGTDFVREICSKTSLPVYAIGGIKPENLEAVKKAGAAGGCMMSGFMRI